MNEIQMIEKLIQSNVAPWRIKLAQWIESEPVVRFLVSVILFNAIILALETDRHILSTYFLPLKIADKICLIIFILEIIAKLLAYRSLFWLNGWNVFDFLVVSIALFPNAGPFAVLRSLRVLRILRLLTVLPSLRKVVAAFLHALPGLGGVIAVMAVFFFTAGVLATNLFGKSFPDWFGTLGRSLYTLFQIMTLESWSMGIVRPVLQIYPYAWLFFIPFIIIATFTILNLFIGIIVSTMQELSTLPDPSLPKRQILETLERIERDIQDLRRQITSEISNQNKN
ncbi:MAG: ion transporter [Chthoniobacterales bacterium]|nr:ion transporter [Chthoniobacterales bacterium]